MRDQGRRLENYFLFFFKKAAKKGYRGFYQPGPIYNDSLGVQRIKGGVALLVNKFVPHKFDCGFPSQNVQGISAWINGSLLINCYAPPGNDLVMAEALNQFWVEQNLDQKQWAVLGDFNALPEEKKVWLLLFFSPNRDFCCGILLRVPAGQVTDALTGAGAAIKIS